MRPHVGHLCDATPDEAAADLLDAFGLEETQIGFVLRGMRLPLHLRAGVNAGRLRIERRGSVRMLTVRVARRLAFRSGCRPDSYVVIRQPHTSRTVRLPFA